MSIYRKKNFIILHERIILEFPYSLFIFEYEIIGDYGFEYAQVTNGGISIDEINQNFEFSQHLHS